MGAFFGIRPFVGVVTALSIAAWFAASAHAATYTVATTADNTGTCVPIRGGCSLRQLIDYENGLASTTPGDTIVIPANDDIDLQNGSLPITHSVSIVGPGADMAEVIQGSESPDRVFDVEATGTLPNVTVPNVTISGLWIADGNANANNGFFGGDVENQGTLALTGDAIVGGTTTAGSGGGIGNDGGTLTVTDSLVYDNESNVSSGAGGDSGGIQNYGPNPVTGTPGTLIVNDSTIAANDAALGGGIFSWCGGGGADPCAQSSAATNTATITNSTIADNNGGDRQPLPTNAGGLYASQGSISVENSIIAGNYITNANGAQSVSNCGTSSPGTVTSLGYNLETSTDCGFKSTGDLQNANPMFTSAVPQDNGGDTSTLGLDAKSPAVDAVPAGGPGCGGADQRACRGHRGRAATWAHSNCSNLLKVGRL